MNEDRTPRRTPLARPAEERATDQSTPESAGLHEGARDYEPGPGPELAREQDVDDVLNRNSEKRYETPRRYDEEPRDPAMPADDSTLNTKI